MEAILFEKHILAINNQKINKKSIIAIIKEKTNIEINEDEISLSKREVILNISSVKRGRIIQKGIKKILEESKFTLKN